MSTDPADSDIAVAARGLVRAHRERGITSTILKGVDLRLQRGKLHVILGASGSGKTTLLNILGGVDRADAGTISVDGVQLSSASAGALTRFRQEHTGFVFQFYNLMPTLTARENVEVALEHRPHRRSEREAMADAMLDLVGLSKHRHKYPAQMSGGEQQRVAVARALVRRPALLLCDEPTGNLDTESGAHVVGLIDQLRRECGSTTIVVTHNPELFHNPDSIVRIKDGLVA